MRLAFSSLLLVAALISGRWLGAAQTDDAPITVGVSTGKYHDEGFDSKSTKWEVKFANERHRKPRRTIHSIDPDDRLGGEAAEHIRLEATGNDQMARLELPLPASRVIDELQLKLWVKSNRRGPVLALRVVFPKQVDPDTGNPLRTIVRGDVYEQVGEWQSMHCRTTEKLLQSGLRRLRNQLRRQLHSTEINTDGAYADKALLICDLSPGTTDIRTDKLNFGPVVPTIPVQDTEREPDVDIPVDFRLGRIFVDDKPFFPRITPYHGEPISQLQQTGFNLIWVPDTEDANVLEQLKNNRMWAMGSPSLNAKSIFHQASMSESGRRSPTDLTKLSSILCWYLGTQMSRSDHQGLVDLYRATREADRGLARPFAADVLDNERVYSRYIEMLAISRHMIGTEFSYRQFRDLISDKRRQALPGTFLWTWIHTEPVPAHVDWRAELGREPMVIEPEQIRLQVYAALAAGCRAIGYWKRGLLRTSNPGSVERQLQIAQLNLELDLLGDWLSSGQLDAQYRVEIIDPTAPRQKPTIGRAAKPRGKKKKNSDLLNNWLKSGEGERVYSRHVEAAAIRSNDGLLLLPVWYGTDSQFVPGDMSARAIRVKVPGGFETAQPYLITTTGVRSLTRNRPSGGLEITLPDFDQTAAIIITTRQDVIERLRQRAQQMAPTSARLGFELATAKLARVTDVDTELRHLGCNPRFTAGLLTEARQQIESAKSLLGSNNYTASLAASRGAMTSLRRLQRAHWETSLNGRSPMVSPHTACFQTLPDHWRLMNESGNVLEQSAGRENLVPLGNFERRDFRQEFLKTGGWKHEQNEHPRIQAGAEVWADAIEGQLCLRLIALPKTKEDPPESIARSPVIVSTPGVAVSRGQVLRVSGMVRVKYPILGSLDGAMVFDGLVGKAGALRWKQTRGWEEFVFLREIPHDGFYSVRFVLDGLGSFEVDDVRIEPVGENSAASDTGPIAYPGRRMNLNQIPDALLPANMQRPVPLQQPSFGNGTLSDRLRRASAPQRR